MDINRIYDEEVKKYEEERTKCEDVAFVEKQTPTGKSYKRALGASATWYVMALGFSVVMNYGLGAAVAGTIATPILGVLGTIAVVAGVVTTLTSGAANVVRHAGLGWAPYTFNRNYVEKTFKSSNTRNIRQAAAYVAYTKAILQHKATDENQGSDFFKMKISMMDLSIHGDDEKAKRMTFYSQLGKAISEGDANPWLKASEGVVSSQISQVVLRGLSRIMNANNLTESVDCLLDDVNWKSLGKKKSPMTGKYIDPEENIPYVALSYKQEGDTFKLGRSQARQAVERAALIAESLTGKKEFRIWVDQLVHGGGQEWVAIGLLPYLLMPVVQTDQAISYTAPRSREESTWISLEPINALLRYWQMRGVRTDQASYTAPRSRKESTWISLEHICASAATTTQLTKTGIFIDLANTRPLSESLSAVAEVLSWHLRSDRIHSTIRESDESWLSLWCKGVLHGRQTEYMYEGIREELGADHNLLAGGKKWSFAMAARTLNCTGNALMTRYLASKRKAERLTWTDECLLLSEAPMMVHREKLREASSFVEGIRDERKYLLVMTDFCNYEVWTEVEVSERNGVYRPLVVKHANQEVLRSWQDLLETSTRTPLKDLQIE